MNLFFLVWLKKLGIYLAYVRYVVPNSEAERKGLQRGDVILSINNQQLTRTNAQQLLQKNAYHSLLLLTDL